jgi:hypothetical protein
MWQVANIAKFLRNVGWFSTDYVALYPEDKTLYNHGSKNLQSYKYSYNLQESASQIWKEETLIQVPVRWYTGWYHEGTVCLIR